MRRFLIVLVLLAALVVAERESARALPSGRDRLPVVATVQVQSLLGQERFALIGWLELERGDSFVEDGRQVVPLTIATLRLQGASRLGVVVASEREGEPSRGQLRSLAPGSDFPASSDFDLVVDVSVPQSPFGALLLRPEIAPHLAAAAALTAWPPLGATFALTLSPPPACIPLIEVQETPSEIGLCLSGLSLSIAPQLPSFSVARGEGARHHPADVLSLAPPDANAPAFLPFVRVPCAALGLTPDGCDDGADGDQDDLDALSFGGDGPANAPQRLEFSVAPGARGAPGSAVEAQGNCPPAKPGISPEPESDVFASALGGANELLFDGNGPVGACVSAFPLGLLESIAGREDLDALDAHDGSPGGAPQPVYFSLREGSPSLAAFGFSPADVLLTSGGAAPATFASAAALGLAAGDELDALCLRENGDGLFDSHDLLYFSLAPGSPSLAAVGAGPGDVLAPGSPPVVVQRAAGIGLLASDDVDALACASVLELAPGDVDCDGAVDSIDAALILQLDGRLLDALPCAANADVNDDAAIDTRDAMLVLQRHAGLQT